MERKEPTEEKEENQVEREAGSIMGCRAPGGVGMQKDPLIW